MRSRALSMPAADDRFEVEAVNAPAVRLFMALQTQWRAVSVSSWSRVEIRRLGLDYAAIEPTARLAGLELDADDFTRLRVMEVEALTAWNEQAARR